MYRSNSASRSLDSSVVSPPPIKQTRSTAGVDLLPRYTQLTEEREKIQSGFKAEHSVHFIPVVLILCGLVLWFAGGAPHEDFALVTPDEAMMSKSSTNGEGLKEKNTSIPVDYLHFKQLNNGNPDGEKYHS